MTTPQLDALQRLVGAWTTEATHPMLPGTVLHGTAVAEWLEGRRFVILRSRTDHPDIPDSISILGYMDRDRADHAGAAAVTVDATQRLTMHYYDSRGVFRSCEASIDDTSWRLERPTPGFSQRFTGTFAGDFRTIVGVWQICTDGANWADDMRITYRRER